MLDGAEGETDGTTLGPPVGMEDSEGTTLGTSDGVELGIQDDVAVGRSLGTSEG